MRHWDAYEAFVAVVECGSYTAAADRLMVSKSAVSRYVSGLEERLGSQLLYRSTRKLAPTDLGRSVYQRCVEAFDNLELIELEAMEHDAQPRGRMRIVASDSFGERWIAPLVAELTKQYSQLSVNLLITDRHVDIVGEGYDLAIRHNSQTDSMLRAQKLCELHHICVASPDYLNREGVPITPEDLSEHNCLLSSFGPCSEWAFRTELVPRNLNLKGQIVTNSGLALIAAAQEGIGIAWLPELYLREHIATGCLVEILQEYRGAPMPTWCVYPAQRQTPAKVLLFIRHLRQRLEEVSSCRLSSKLEIA